MRRIAAFALIAFAALAAPVRAATSALGDIPLVDQSGATFHLRDLGGRPAAITFVSTRCHDTCPMSNAIFAQLSRTAPRARFVTISLDPAYDTPFVMANYAREMAARAPAWRIATGRPRDVERVLAAFGVVRERGADGIPDAHSSFIYVLNRRGALDRTLPLSTNAIAEVRSAIARPAL